MKKIFTLLVTALMLTALFAGCSQKKNESSVSSVDMIRLGGLKGPTSMGMVKLLDDAENGLTANDYEFTLAGSAIRISH